MSLVMEKASQDKVQVLWFKEISRTTSAQLPAISGCFLLGWGCLQEPRGPPDWPALSKSVSMQGDSPQAVDQHPPMQGKACFPLLSLLLGLPLKMPRNSNSLS